MKANRVAHIFDDDREPQRGDFAIAVGADDAPASFLICCPGCGVVCALCIRADGARPVWQWDGNADAPTLKPSINHVGCWHGWLTAGEFTP